MNVCCSEKKDTSLRSCDKIDNSKQAISFGIHNPFYLMATALSNSRKIVPKKPKKRVPPRKAKVVDYTLPVEKGLPYLTGRPKKAKKVKPRVRKTAPGSGSDRSRDGHREATRTDDNNSNLKNKCVRAVEVPTRMTCEVETSSAKNRRENKIKIREDNIKHGEFCKSTVSQVALDIGRITKSNVAPKRKEHPRKPKPKPIMTPAAHRKCQFEKAITTENKAIAKRLDNQYKIRKDSYVVSNGYGPGTDCRELWAQRTNVYREGKLGSHHSAIPKTLGSVRCSGCGVESFYRADGDKFGQCPKCKSAWYCSLDCFDADWDTHRPVCMNIRFGLRTLVRAPGYSWVTSGAMAKGLKLIRRKNRYGRVDAVPQSGKEIAAMVGRERREELEKDREKEAKAKGINLKLSDGGRAPPPSSSDSQ